MSSPLRRIFPLDGISKPAIILSVVVFPHPDGPKNVTNSPLFTSRLKSSTALKPLSSYTLHIFLSSIIFFTFSSIISSGLVVFICIIYLKYIFILVTSLSVPTLIAGPYTPIPDVTTLYILSIFFTP